MTLFRRSTPTLDMQTQAICAAIDGLTQGELGGTLSGGAVVDRVAPAIARLQAELIRQRAQTAALRAAVAEMRAQHDAGVIDAVVATDTLAEPHRAIAADVNALVKSHIDVKLNVVRLVSDYANGDFSADMDRLPGQKAHVTAALDRAKTTFMAVSAQAAESKKFIGALAEMSKQHELGWIDDVIAVDDFLGDYKQAADMVNQLVRAHIAVKMKIVRLVTEYAQGDFSHDMDRLPGKKAQITEAIDQAKATFQAVNAQAAEAEKFVAALAEMTRQHELGWIDEVIPVDAFGGGYKRAAEMTNTLVRAHIDVKMKIVELVTDYAHGDFSQSIDRLPGKKALITEAIDQAKATFQAVNEQAAESEKFIGALAEMSKQHELGWIDEGIPVHAFVGGYKLAAEMTNTLVRAHIDVKMKIVKLVTDYAHGDFSQAMDRLPGKKAQITEAMDRVRGLLPRPDDIADMKRVKAALNNVKANVMISDAANIICYMNPALKNMLRYAERDMQKDLPNLRVDALIGTTTDEFNRNQTGQTRLFGDVRTAQAAEVVIGGRTFAIVANPIIDENGGCLGAVIEWNDRTLEVTIETETADIVAAASRGDFTKRLNVDGKAGFFKQFAENINGLLQTCDVGLNDVVRVLAALAGGDLTQKIVDEYSGTFGQLKNDSNATVDSLTRTVVEIKEAAEIVSTSAREIAAGNTDLSQRTEEQASSLAETAASMEQLTATVRQNADNAKQANGLAIGASDIAIKGGEVVGEVVLTMAAINASAKKIVDIISVIDGIAFQTNILALNAAVEAARAGEQGRGFAVVAGEVRTLAQRSAAAAKEIKSLIGDSVDKTATGSALVDQAGKTMAEIVASVKRVTTIMAAIASASEEQGGGIEQVNEAVSQMDKVTQQNAALVEEIAASAESLEERAQALVGVVSVFNLGPSQGGAAPVTRSRPTAVASRATAIVSRPALPARRAGKDLGTPPPFAAPRLGGVTPVHDDADWSSF